MKMLVLSLALLTSASAFACEGGIFEGDVAIVRSHLGKQLDCRHANMRVPGTLKLSTARCLGARPKVTLAAGGRTYNIIRVDEDLIRGTANYKLKLTFTTSDRRHPVSCLTTVN